jgi:tetratricopeptide (TPR) repeat protein
VDRADGATIIDLLGQVRSPEAALRNVRACLSSEAPVFVAEPHSYVSQRLSSPVRRGFSIASLSRLLIRTGFRVVEPLCSAGTFLALIAKRSNDPANLAVCEGFQRGERGDFQQARERFARVTATAPLDVQVEARLGEAELAFATGDGDGAARGFFLVNTLAPLDGRGWTGLARLALATGQFEEASELALDAVRRDPTEAEPHALSALAAEQLEQQGALAAWRIAANLAPDDLAIASGLARVATAEQNWGFAIQVFERLRDYGDSLAPEVHVTLGWLLLAEGRKNDAAIEARYAAMISPDAPGLAELLRAVA